MGSPIALLMAVACVHKLRYRSGFGGDTNGVSTKPALLLCRLPVLLFPNQDSLNRLFTNITSIHRNIVFTKELETNNCLHFLHVLIKKSSTRFITSTYRKLIHTGLHSKWSSLILLHRKWNLVNSLLCYTYDIASSYKLMHTEFMNVDRILSRNGYPNNFWTVAFSNS